jgi:hypothetical protein
MDDQHAPPARAFQQGADRADGPLQQGYVVPERLAETARFQEVPLHVDDDDGGADRIDVDGFGFGLDGCFAHRKTPSSPRGLGPVQDRI